MKHKTALVFYYTDTNRYSYNALMGSLETDEYFNDLEIFCIKDSTELIKKLDSITNTFEVTILGISFFTIQKDTIAQFLNYIKSKYDSNIIYVAGGPHPTAKPKETLQLGFNFVVYSEGEESFKSLLKTIDSGSSPFQVKGVAFFDSSGKFVFTGKNNQIDINLYLPITTKYNHYGPIEITRGCSFGCSYCQTSYLFGKKLRHRSVENILKYVEYMAKINLKDFRAISPDAFSYGSEDGKQINYSEIEKLLCGIKKIVKPEGKVFFGTFPSEVRPEHVNDQTIKLILKYTDNTNLVVGAQSGSQKILDLCNRKHTVEDIIKSVEVITKHKLKANVDFIFGLPGETEEDVLETLKLMEKLVKFGVRIHAHTFSPLPQTPFANKKHGSIHPKIKEFLTKYLPEGKVYGNNFTI